MSQQPTPGQVAHNDQILAVVNGGLDGLIRLHREVTTAGDMHPQVLLAGLSTYLERNLGPADMAQVLAVAIDRLMNQQVPS